LKSGTNATKNSDNVDKFFFIRNFTKRRSLSDEAFFYLMTERLREKMDSGRMSSFIGHHLCLSLDAIRPLMELPQLGMQPCVSYS
jgi:RAB protein geranylgeranyltransferase component A